MSPRVQKISMCKVKFIILPPKLVLYLCSRSSEPPPPPFTHLQTRNYLRHSLYFRICQCCLLNVSTPSPCSKPPYHTMTHLNHCTGFLTGLPEKPLTLSRVVPSKRHSDRLKPFHKESLIVLGPEPLPVASRPWGVQVLPAFPACSYLLSSCMPLLSALSSQGLCTDSVFWNTTPLHTHTCIHMQIFT